MGLPLFYAGHCDMGKGCVIIRAAKAHFFAAVRAQKRRWGLCRRVTSKKFLQSLSKDYPTVAAATEEIINLNAILKLPKPTEHFMSDVHGEAEAFGHILSSASGVIREKVDRVLGPECPSASARNSPPSSITQSASWRS